MGLGKGSKPRPGSLEHCQKQKDKRLWRGYSRLDIKHHLRYDGTSRLFLSMELSEGVDVNYVMPCMLSGHVSQGPFHSYGVRRHLVNRARNDVLHKNKEKLFSICPATYARKSGTWPLQTTPHLRGSKSWTCPCGYLRGSNKSNWTVHQWHFRKEASFPWLVQTVCLLLAVVFGFYWNLRPVRNSQPQKLLMGFWQRAIQ